MNLPRAGDGFESQKGGSVLIKIHRVAGANPLDMAGPVVVGVDWNQKGMIEGTIKAEEVTKQVKQLHQVAQQIKIPMNPNAQVLKHVSMCVFALNVLVLIQLN